MSLNESAPHSAPPGGIPSGANLPGGGGGTTTDFHRLFPQVPSSENVVQEFQCSLSRKKLLRVGRLYVTPVRLCFSSMLVEPVELTWEEVASCDKKTAMLFDQIIVKPTDTKRFGGELCFTGFMNGCSSPFSTIKMLWNVRKKYGHKATSPSLTSPANNASLGSAPSTAASPKPPTEPDFSAGSRGASVPASPTAARAVTPTVSAAAPAATSGRTARAVTPPATMSAAAAVDPAPAGKTPSAVASPSSPATLGPPAKAETPVSAQSPRPLSPVADDEKPAESVSPPAAVEREQTMEPQAAAFVSPATKPQEQPQDPAAESTCELPNESFGAESPGVRSRTTSNGAATAGMAAAAAAVSASSPDDAVVPQETPKSRPPPRPEVMPAGSPDLPRAATPVSRFESPARVSSQSPTAASPAAHRRTRSDGISHPDPAQLQAASANQSDFLRTFPNVPRTESILDSFQCSYVSGVHRLGKMHITGNFLLFHSVMLGEPVVVKLVDIAKLDKLTSLLVLDGMSIVLRDGTKHDFTSFISREKAFSMLQQLITTHHQMARTLGSNTTAGGRPQTPPVINAASPVPEGASRQLNNDSTTSGESPTVGAASPVGAPASPHIQPVASSSAGASPTAAETPAAASAAAAGPPPPVQLVTSVASSSSAFIDAADINELEAICPTDYGSALSKPALFLDTPLTEEFTMPAGYTLFDVFRWVFDNDAPIGVQYREFRRDTDFEWEPWRNAGPSGKQLQAGQRTMRCQTIIRALIAEKYYPYEEFNRFAFMNIGGTKTLVFQTSGQASGVTFSDTFRTESLLVYKESVDPATKLPRVTARHYMYVQFLKFSIVKSKIRTESTKELKEGMRKHNELTAEYLRSAPSSSSLGQALASGKAAAATAALPGATAAPSVGGAQQPPAATGATPAPAAARPAPAAPLARHDSQLQPRRAGGPVASIGAAQQGASGPSVLVPEAMSVKFAMLPMLALALLYTLKAVWNSFWFYPDVVPLAAGIEGAAVAAEATPALQQLAAANTAAAVMADVLRPAVTALAWALGAALISWITAMAP